MRSSSYACICNPYFMQSMQYYAIRELMLPYAVQNAMHNYALQWLCMLMRSAYMLVYAMLMPNLYICTSMHAYAFICLWYWYAFLFKLLCTFIYAKPLCTLIFMHIGAYMRFYVGERSGGDRENKWCYPRLHLLSGDCGLSKIWRGNYDDVDNTNTVLALY